MGVESGEPTIGVLSDGRIAVHGWERRADAKVGTASVAVVDPRTGTSQVVLAPGSRASHDPYLWVDPDTDRAFIADLQIPGELDPELFCSVVSFSDDAGTTWIDAARHCTATPEDRPRIITGRPTTQKPTGYPNVVYLCFQDYEGRHGHVCARSLDGGRTFGDRGGEAWPYGETCDGGFGHAAVGPDGGLWLVTAGCGTPRVAVSRDEGLTWTRADAAPAGTSGDGEAGIAVDPEGVIHVVWTGNDRLPRLAHSVDGGVTWSEPLIVAAPGVTETNLATIAVGGQGKIAIAYLASRDAPGGLQPSVPNECFVQPCTDRIGWEAATWDAWMTVSDNALDPKPTFVSAVVSDPDGPVVRGTCGPGRCKSVVDFIDVSVAPDGRPWMAWPACPDGRCPVTTAGRGAWASVPGMLATLEGMSLH